MENIVRKIYHDNYGVYGAKRIYEILKLKGYRVSYKTIYGICHRNGLMSVRYKIKNIQVPKPVKEYLNKRASRSVTDKVIKFALKTLNEVWVTDWTHFFVHDKIIYLYLIMDLFSRRILGYGVSFDGENVETQINEKNCSFYVTI